MPSIEVMPHLRSWATPDRELGCVAQEIATQMQYFYRLRLRLPLPLLLFFYYTGRTTTTTTTTTTWRDLVCVRWRRSTPQSSSTSLAFSASLRPVAR